MDWSVNHTPFHPSTDPQTLSDTLTITLPHHTGRGEQLCGHDQGAGGGPPAGASQQACAGPLDFPSRPQPLPSPPTTQEAQAKVASETTRANNAENQVQAAQALAATETTRANTAEERKVTLLNVDVVHALLFMRHGAIGRG